VKFPLLDSSKMISLPVGRGAVVGVGTTVGKGVLVEMTGEVMVGPGPEVTVGVTSGTAGAAVQPVIDRARRKITIMRGFISVINEKRIERDYINTCFA
jgi:hypothetical protein